MIVPEEIIRGTLTDVVELYLKPKFIELGMDASGQWLRSLEVRTSLNRGEIWGMNYTYWLSEGRRPGKRPPIAPLVQWVGNKFGLYGKEAVSAAYGIANKIAKEGTSYYPNGTDLITILQSDEVKQFINRKIGDYLIEQTRLTILEKVKNTLITV